MPIGMDQLTRDLLEETRSLRGLLADLDAEGWDRPTPAEGWSVRDQVSHLAHFDDAALLSATDPEAFRAEALEFSDGRLSPDDIAARHRDLPVDRLLSWFDTSRARLISTFAGLEPGRRLPWYGPPMSAASSVTARIMETWAHGYDVADALGVTPEPTDRLRHVAHIGVRALPFSYALRRAPGPHRADPGGADLARRRALGLGPGGRAGPGRRAGPGLLPAGHPAPPPRRPDPARHRAGGHRVGLVRAGLRR